MENGIFAQWHYEDGKVIGHSCDGMGSKLIFHLKYGNLDDAAQDLAAMNLDDLSCEYIQPSKFWDTISIWNDDLGLRNRMIDSLGKTLERYNIVLMGGETASLPHQLREGKVLWDGIVYGSENDNGKHKFYMERRDSLEEGLFLHAVPDNDGSLGSNGFTFLQEVSYRKGFTIPCRVYTPQMLKARDYAWFFAHITGGGYRNIERILPSNLDAVIELRNIPDVFKHIQDKIGFTDKKMFETYHHGSRLIMGDKNVDKIMEVFEDAFLIGELKKGDGSVFVNGIKLDPY